MTLPPPLLALSPGTLRDLEQAPPFLERVVRARAGGLSGLLLREPGLDDRATLSLLAALRRIFDAPDDWVGLHDRVHLARAAGVQGVHLGERSLLPRTAREQLPAEVAVGFSAHAHDAADVREGADYLFLGPLHPVPGKRSALGFEGLARELRRTPTPVWALGGLAPEECGLARAAGAHGVALLRGILGASDPQAAARRARSSWDAA